MNPMGIRGCGAEKEREERRESGNKPTSMAAGSTTTSARGALGAERSRSRAISSWKPIFSAWREDGRQGRRAPCRESTATLGALGEADVALVDLMRLRRSRARRCRRHGEMRRWWWWNPPTPSAQPLASSSSSKATVSASARVEKGPRHRRRRSTRRNQADLGAAA